jgi:eukaryotic-like serine/threonine-protein kinase
MNKNDGSNGETSYRFDDFFVNERNRLLFKDGEEIRITPKVLDILLVFLANSGRLLEKDEIIATVWNERFVEEGNLSRNVSTLRRALGGSAQDHRYIVTIPGKGYRFVADVSRENEGGTLVHEERVIRRNSARRVWKLWALIATVLISSTLCLTDAYYRSEIVAAPSSVRSIKPAAQ